LFFRKRCNFSFPWLTSPRSFDEHNYWGEITH
jgi:hypothetical protein